MINYKELTDKQKLRYDRILQYAERIIYEQGFYKLSLGELTKALKVSKSTLYENFGSKDGLVEKVVELFDQKLDDGLSEIIQNKKLSIPDKFLAIAHKQSEAMYGLNTYQFFNDLKIHAPHLWEKYLQGRIRRERAYYKPLIEEGIKKGQFDKKLQPDFILQLYIKMVNMVCDTDMLHKSSINKVDGLDTVIRIFLNGAKKLK